MSAKWRRSLAWDDQAFPRWAWPAKATLRAFSSIPLAVALLSLVSLYSLLASVPIGLLARVPTYLIYLATLLVVIGVVTLPPVWLLRRLLRGRPAWRFAGTILAGVPLAALAFEGWWLFAWPHLQWDPAHGKGLMLFAEFCRAYESTTLRRLPAFEMTEPQFYAWWPMRVLLILFVVNMVIATVRRIEFRFVNLGVLTVHAGIVVLAVGSMHYQTLKQEGDVVLFANMQDSGQAGPPASSFYDRDIAALWANLDGFGWEQMPLPDLPRYNDYGPPLTDRELDLTPIRPRDSWIPEDLTFRIVGYASYAELEAGWAALDANADPAPGATTSPLVDLTLLSSVPGPEGEQTGERPAATLRLASASPRDRLASLARVLSVEFVPQGQSSRWGRLSEPFPTPGEHALRIRLADEQEGDATTHVVRDGSIVERDGYRIEVDRLLPEPPFPIITEGYRGAQSSVAVLRIEPPDGEAYTRYVYHRFPEIDQDVLGVNADGRPIRRDADPAIAIDYLDASGLQVYLSATNGWIIRSPGGGVRTGEALLPERRLEIAPAVALRIDALHERGAQRELPIPVPENERDRSLYGTRGSAAAAVEVRTTGGLARTVWIPFSRYLGIDRSAERTITLNDGRELRLSLSRVNRPLPDIALQLIDFEMIPYPHSDIPRDYISTVKVTDMRTGRAEVRTARLNHPIIERAAMTDIAERSPVANALASIVGLIAPNQYKFSQAGWDAEGWKESKALVDAGQLEEPQAAFTILGVGNNPGIYIIAAGGVMICLGTPWAFYIKPWLLRRRSAAIREKAGEDARKLRAAAGGARPTAQPAGASA